MAAEPADVLIIGAGASGGVVARRLAEAGFKVTCLEQGEWHDKSEYRGVELDWELDDAQAVGDQPQRPRSRRRLPARRDGRGCLAADVQRRRRLDAHLRRRLAAHAAQRFPRPHPRRHRRRLATDVQRAAALLRAHGPRVRGLGAGRRSGVPAGRRRSATAATAARPGRPQGGASSRSARLALVARAELDPLRALRRPAPVRPARNLPAGLQRGRQGLDRPDPLAQGNRHGRPADHRRTCLPPGDERQRPRHRRDVARH